MLVTFCPKNIFFAHQVNCGVQPKTGRRVHERDSAVLIRAANSTFNATLHGMVVGDHRLQNDVIFTAEIHHFLRIEFFSVVNAQVARRTARCNNVLFQ